jgi:hypothetical protein
MVGGGQRWLIETVGETTSELWEPFERVGDQKDPKQKIWLCTHIRQSSSVPRAELDADVAALPLETAVANFRAALVSIEGFARKERYDNFADIFRDAISEIDGKGPETNDRRSDHARFTAFGPRELAIIDAAGRSWVFGGMGSWNDLPGGPEYDDVSQSLYDTLNDVIAALANSTFGG